MGGREEPWDELTVLRDERRGGPPLAHRAYNIDQVTRVYRNRPL